jgi:hypothetical protein
MKSFNKNSFLFPTPHKLILGIVLFFVFGWIVWPTIIESLASDWFPIGFPFTIDAVTNCEGCVDFSWIAVILDVVLWYIVSAVIIRAQLRMTSIAVVFVLAVFTIWAVSFVLVEIGIFPFW